MKKIICTILTIALSVSLLSACGSTAQQLENITAPAAEDPLPTVSQDTPISENDDEAVQMISTPDSSCFSEIGYSDGTLVVTFRDSGASYAYYDVPSAVWDALCNADSMGGYYNSDIKGQYNCEKLE